MPTHRRRPSSHRLGRWLLCLLLLASAALPAAEEFKVALTGAYPPFSMYDAQGELAGFDVDVARAIAERLERPLTLVATSWDGIIAGLQAGHYDAIIGSMAIKPEREKKVDFSDPYYISGAQLFVHEDLKGEIGGIEDCNGRRLGVVLGESFEAYLREHHPEIEAVAYKSTVDIFADVRGGRLAGFISDRLLGVYQIEQADQPFIAAGPLLYEEHMAIPVRQGEDELLAAIDRALADMRADGTLDELFDKWFDLSLIQEDAGPTISAATVARLLGKGFALTLFIALSSIVCGFLLAIPGGIVLNARDNPLHWLARTVDDFIRGTPVLIQLFFVYFALGQYLNQECGINLPPLVAAILTLSINAAAYMAEVVRSGLMAVPAGQREAARALGLNRFQTFRHVVWPQAFRIAIPPLMNSIVALIKDTALVSLITVPEVIQQAQRIIAINFDPSLYYLIVAVMFFAVTFPLMKAAGMLEQHIRKRGFTGE